MLDTTAVETLAQAIKAAFEGALPPDLPPDARESIVQQYQQVSTGIAEAIKNFVLSARVKTVFDRDGFKFPFTLFAKNSFQREVKDSRTGAIIGYMTFSGNDVASTMSRATGGAPNQTWTKYSTLE